MLDFDFKWRWGRVLYIGALATAIGYFFSIWPALICALAIIDIKFEDGLFTFWKDEVEDESNETFGPTHSGT